MFVSEWEYWSKRNRDSRCRELFVKCTICIQLFALPQVQTFLHSSSTLHPLSIHNRYTRASSLLYRRFMQHCIHDCLRSLKQLAEALHWKLNHCILWGSLLNLEFNLEALQLIFEGLLPGHIRIPFCAEKYIAGVDVFKIEFVNGLIGRNIF